MMISTDSGVASQSPTGYKSKTFQIPAFAIKDNLLLTNSLPDFLTLFALYKNFAENNKGKTQLTNTITIAEIARVTAQDSKDPQTPGKIQAALEHLKETNLIDYCYLQKRCLKQLDLTQSVGALQRKHGKEIWEGDQKNYHAAIFYEFTKPPIVEKIKVNERERLNQLDRFRENNSIPVKIPCNLCLTVKEIVQQTKASRSALSLHKLALYVSTITNLPKIEISLTRLNEIIGYKSQSKGKTYNINLISNLLQQLVSSGFIKGFEKQEMTNPTCFEISFLREPSKGKSENIKGNKGTDRKKEAGKRIIKARVKARVESQAGEHKSQILNAFAPEREVPEREVFVIKSKPVLKQQVR